MLDPRFKNMFGIDKKIKKQFNHKLVFDKMLNLLSIMDIDKQSKQKVREVLIETRYILNKSIRWKDLQNITIMYYILDNHRFFMKKLNNSIYDEFDRNELLINKTELFHDIILSFEKGDLTREQLLDSIKSTLLNSGQFSEEDVNSFLSLIGMTSDETVSNPEEQFNEIMEMIKQKEETDVSTDKTEE